MMTFLSTAARFLPTLGLAVLLVACSDTDPGPTLAVGENVALPDASPPAITREKGMYFKPDLSDFTFQNEYDADGNGDGVKETRVQRFINSKGDTAFSMTTGERLWAWSLDTQEDASDIHKNFVIRDSNCDGVFDERYSLNAEYHVPTCLLTPGISARPQGTVAPPISH